MTAPNNTDPRQAFFNTVAGSWDGWHNLAVLNTKLTDAFKHFGVQPSETVVDVGCGTGNLTQALLPILGSEGKVVALDISPAMLEQAKRKVSDPRVTWCETSAEKIPMADASCNRIICFSTWPHLLNQEAVVQEFARVLLSGGRAHILHFMSKEKVNCMHGDVDPAVRDDILAPASEVAELFTRNGFDIIESKDDADGYLLTAQKRA